MRIVNRKSSVVKTSKLVYEEIGDPQPHLNTLTDLGWIKAPHHAPLAALASTLTKPELSGLLKNNGVDIPRTIKKADLESLAIAALTDLDVALGELAGTYIWRNTDKYTDYFFYLFFGDFFSRMDKFSMRDLGVMNTRKNTASRAARFDYQEDAHSAYDYGKRLKTLNQYAPEEVAEQAAEYRALPKECGDKAEDYRNRYLSALGQAVAKDQPDLALDLWSVSDDPVAQEKWCRHAYKAGLKDEVKARLEQIIAEPPSDTLLLFAEDFLARKFEQKRTSVLTDMLRASNEVICLDDMHRNSVERGVQQAMQRQGVEVYRTENELWRALFSLVFWRELFASGSNAVVNEFDFRPRVIYRDCFYQESAECIESVLAQFQSKQDLLRHLHKTATGAYGKANGLFRWRSNLLEVLNQLVEHAPLNGLINHLRAMSQTFKTLSDGYPDLMVIENAKLRFTEVKAQGDQVRRNQLITLRQLQRCGFDVGITQVTWGIDPAQPYVVVDIETTGGKASGHRITEIGMVKMIDGEIVDRWQSLINPQRHIPAYITKLTGINNEMVADAPVFAEVTEQLDAFLADSIFVAHNVNFDYGFFKLEYERLERSFQMPKLCTVVESRRTFPGLKSYSLANLTSHFGIDMTRHHRAMSDAEAAAEILQMVQTKRIEQAKAQT